MINYYLQKNLYRFLVCKYDDHMLFHLYHYHYNRYLQIILFFVFYFYCVFLYLLFYHRVNNNKMKEILKIDLCFLHYFFVYFCYRKNELLQHHRSDWKSKRFIFLLVEQILILDNQSTHLSFFLFIF